MYRVLLIICYVCIIYGTTNVHAAESEYNVHNSKIYFRFGESVIKVGLEKMRRLLLI